MSEAFRKAARSSAPAMGGATEEDIFMRVAGMLVRANGAASLMGAGLGTAAAATGSALVVGAAAGMPPAIAALGGLYAIGRANERGAALARHNAFIVGFARAVSDFSRGRDQRRLNVAYRDASVQGRNAAIAVLDRVGSDQRAQVFSRYSRMPDGRAVDTIVAIMGGLRTR